MTHNQEEAEKKGKEIKEEREELLEKTRKAREARQQHNNPPGQAGGQVPRPPADDPRHTDTSVPPEQANVPTGGTTGGAMGGSTKRKKD